MKSVYSKFDIKKRNAIKKKKTMKKRKNTYVKRKKTFKKKRTTHLVKLNRINQGGGGSVKELKSLFKEFNNLSDNFKKYSEEFKKYFNLYETQMNALNNKYVETINSDVKEILTKCIRNNNINLIIDDTDTYHKRERKFLLLQSKSFEEKKSIQKQQKTFLLMRTRMVLLNKIYRFSKDIGQFSKVKKVDKNFYYKHRLKRFRRGTMGSLTSKSSKIRRNFANSDNLWGMIAQLREYELYLNKYKILFKDTLFLITNPSDTTKPGILEEIKILKKRLNNEVKIPFTDEELGIINTYKSELVPTIKKFNEYVKKKVHYFIPPCSTKNTNLLLINLPKKVSFFKVSREEYNNNNGNITNTETRTKHENANLNVFTNSKKQIDKYFASMVDIFNDSKSYIDRFKVFHDNYINLQKLNSLYLFDLEKKPYIDMGQISMLSYENTITNKLKESRNQSELESNEKKPYSNNMEYFNNILHLPQFLLNNIKLIFLKNQEDLGNVDIKNIQDIDQESIGNIIFYAEDLNVERDLENDLTDENNARNITNPINLNRNNNNETKIPIKLPVSCYHAFFKIKNMTLMKEIKFRNYYNFFGKKKIKIDSKDIKSKEQLDTIASLFFINKKEDIIIGTLLYLYKQTAHLTDFILSDKNTGMFNLFFNDLLKIENYQDESKFKCIKQNLGIFNGITDFRLYLTYAMIVYIQHCNRLAECVNELNEITKIIYDIYKEKNKAKIAAASIPNFKTFETLKSSGKDEIKDINVNNSDSNNTKKYYYNDELIEKDYNKYNGISTNDEYKPLLVKLKTDIFITKEISDIKDIVTKIIPKFKGDNPSFTFHEFKEKLNIASIKADLNSNNKDINIIYKTPTSIKIEPINKPVFNDIKSIVNPTTYQNIVRQTDTNNDDINSIEKELLFLILLSSKGEENIHSNLMKGEFNQSDINKLEILYKSDQIKSTLLEDNKLLLNPKCIIFKKKHLQDLIDIIDIMSIKVKSFEKVFKQTQKFKENLDTAKGQLESIINKNNANKNKIIEELKKNSEITLVNFIDGSGSGSNNSNSNLNFELDIILKETSDNDTTINRSVDLYNSINEFKSATFNSTNKYLYQFKKGDQIVLNDLDNVPEWILNHPSFISKYGIELEDESFNENIKKYNDIIKFVDIYYTKLSKLESDTVATRSEKGINYYPYQFLLLKINLTTAVEKKIFLTYSDKKKEDINKGLNDAIIEYYNDNIGIKLKEYKDKVMNSIAMNVEKVKTELKNMFDIMKESVKDGKENILDEIKKTIRALQIEKGDAVDSEVNVKWFKTFFKNIWGRRIRKLSANLQKKIDKQSKDKIAIVAIIKNIETDLDKELTDFINTIKLVVSESEEAIVNKYLYESLENNNSYDRFKSIIEKTQILTSILSTDINTFTKKYEIRDDKYNELINNTIKLNLISENDYNVLKDEYEALKKKEELLKKQKDNQDTSTRIDETIIPKTIYEKNVKLIANLDKQLVKFKRFSEHINKKIKDTNFTTIIYEKFETQIKNLLQSILNNLKKNFILIENNDFEQKKYMPTSNNSYV